MKETPNNILKDERGQEPTVMRILVGIILVSLGLGIGVTLYQRVGEEVQDFGFSIEFPDYPEGEVTMSPGENKWISVQVKGEFDIEEGKSVSLNAQTAELDVEWQLDNNSVKIGNTKQMKIIVENDTVAREDPYLIEVEGQSGGNSANKTLFVKVE